mgnify:CR=1 FL=1
MRKFIYIMVLLVAGAVMAITIDPKADLAAIEKAIKSGYLGENLAKRAQKAESLYLTELKDTGEYRVFSFSDFKAGYTAMIDKDTLVLLCKAVGGGTARNFKVSNRTGHKILYFEYDEGSGINRRKKAQYSLGTKKSLVTDEN